MSDILINREQALARERELEAEAKRWEAMYWQRNDEFYRLDVRTSEELRSLREQNATLRAEVERLQRLPSCGQSGCQRCAKIDAMTQEGGVQ